MPGKAPVEKVGGTRQRGPWPEGVEEIVEDKAYRRPVRVADGSYQEVEVTVTDVVEVVDEFGNPTGGRAVTMQFQDPTGGSE